MTRNQGTNQRPNFEQVNNDAGSRPQGHPGFLWVGESETSDRKQISISPLIPLSPAPLPPLFPFLFLLLHILYLPGTRHCETKIRQTWNWPS